MIKSKKIHSREPFHLLHNVKFTLLLQKYCYKISDAVCPGSLVLVTSGKISDAVRPSSLVTSGKISDAVSPGSLVTSGKISDAVCLGSLVSSGNINVYTYTNAACKILI